MIKNDKKAKSWIYIISIIVFLAIISMDRMKIRPNWPFDFDVHIFALFNAIINGTVFVLLIAALVMVKQKKYSLHRKLMSTAIVLSIMFLISYTIHHLFAGSTPFGGSGGAKAFYFFILLTHIPLSAIVMPFILFAAYRGLIGEYEQHKKIVRYAFPIWLYVALSGVLVYILISPYY